MWIENYVLEILTYIFCTQTGASADRRLKQICFKNSQADKQTNKVSEEKDIF